ncbi:carboxypeptidase-like regulatory domain-containing protein [Lewinella sp. 4G2]|uniref:carboxypeptidase-like regulatory domain-containing protein n=1 Tax=Lewinella sp. 4G2 TaxID=1803372 RepID=UPI0007B4D678|nr:carboxypeptidase-like regulatory domain-containing protein [Lewinella sp. 4G2]OAV44261.1 hypothetical protein A3850_007025 [Lewinella sp. 4G2]
MKLRLPVFLLFLFLFFGTRASAQRAPGVDTTFLFPERTERIYAISAKLARQLVLGELPDNELPELDAPLPPGALRDTLRPGHYLRAAIYGTEVDYQYFDTYAHTVQVDGVKGKFEARIFDKNGKNRADATVLADDKRVRYDKKRQAYVRRDWHIDLLTVVVDTDTLLYRITEDIDKTKVGWLLRRARYSLPGRTIAYPYVIGRRTYKYVQHGFRWGQWRIHNYPLKRYIYPIINPRNAIGYVTTSQPKYRPGDTLRVSAYVASPKGRPLGADSLEMVIRKQGSYAPVLIKNIPRSEKGRYTYAGPIDPNWTLDKRYTISFDREGFMKRDVNAEISFQLEDYELAEYELTAEASEETRFPNSAYVDVVAEDVNGLALPDAELSLTLYLDKFTAAVDTAGSISLPDSLITITQPTDNRREHRLVLPDSLFPVGYALSVLAEVQLTGPSGEYQEQSLEMTIDRRYAQVATINVAADSLKIQLRGRGEPAATSGELLRISPRLDTVREVVTLPYSETINHFLYKYEFQFGDQIVSQDLSELRPATSSPAAWSRDTIKIHIPNPHNQPRSNWQLISGQGVKNELYMWDGDMKHQRFSGFPPGKTYTLQYQYLAGGVWRTASFTTTSPRYDWETEHPNVLNLEMEQPEEVRPGETVRVAVKATDHKGRPAQNVRLSAGTYNARFEDSPVTLPTYIKKRKRQRRRQKYALATYKRKFTGTASRWLLENAGIDTAAVYRLRYPTPEWTLRRSIDTLLPDSAAIAHFAPFIMEKSAPIAIRTVYADDRLVYWYHPNITTPYSIPLNTGWHDIVLRTDEARYAKKLHFNAGEQLVLSFERALHAGAGWKKDAMPEWEEGEIEELWKRVFAVTKMETTAVYNYRTKRNEMFQSGTGHHYQAHSPLGLATYSDLIEFHFPYGGKANVPFEPKAVYKVRMDRDRLYSLEKEEVARMQRQVVRNAIQSPGLPRYALPTPILPKSGIAPLSTKNLPKLTPAMEKSRIQLLNLPDTISEIVIAPTYQNTLYKFEGSKINTLLPGSYFLIFKNQNGNLYATTITTRPNQLLLVDFNKVGLDIYIPPLPSENLESKHVPGDTLTEQTQTFIDLPDDFDGAEVSGYVINEDGIPLIGVTLLVDGTTRGTVTDLDGKFSLDLPAKRHIILVSYLGYKSTEIDVRQIYSNSDEILITLEADWANLEEVVVVGYGTTLKRDITGSIVTIASKAAGVKIIESGNINIRGSRTNTTTYYVDGVKVDEAPNILIRGATSLPAEGLPVFIDGIAQELPVDFAAIKGIVELNVENGTVYITTNNPANLLPPADAEPDVRESFADLAAFIPHLATDSRGEAAFDVTFPDDITAWQTYAVGQDRRRRIGFTRKRTKSFLPLQAQLYLPRFLVQGDESEARALAINRTGSDRTVRLAFSGDNIERSRLDTVLQTSIAKTFPIRAGETTDSLRYQFSLVASPTPAPGTRGSAQNQTPTSDGEQRDIRVYPRGTEMVAGERFMLGKEGLRIPENYTQAGRGNLQLTIVGNRLEQLLGDLEYITDYPYACAEQTASRLLGLLALRDIRLAEGKAFNRDRDVRKMIKHLEKLQQPDGGFGWWANSTFSTVWITRHAYRALSAAEKSYPVAHLEPVRRYLFSELPTMRPNDRLQTHLVLAENGRPPTQAEMATVDTITIKTDFQLLAVSRLHQLRGDTVDVTRILDSASTHQLQGRYWGERGRFFYRAPLDNRLNATLLAHRILRKTGATEAADEAVNYLLGQTPNGNRPGSTPLLGTNTLESARLVADLLPDLIEESETLRPPTVTVRHSGTSEVVREFPYVASFSPDAARSLELSRDGAGPIPGAFYQRYFEREAKPTDNGYAISTQLTDARGRPLDALTKGQTAYLQVTVTAKKDGEYVLIEAPIPAGCSYADRMEAKGSYAVHREYRRDRVAIFCDRLPAGEYTYKIALAPRFRGAYTLNPARVELQYLPVVNGNGGILSVPVR